MDIREYLFQNCDKQIFSFAIFANESGVFACSESLLKVVQDIGLQDFWVERDGTFIRENSIVLKAKGNPFQVIKAEEKLLGLIGKTSGVATAAYNYVKSAGGKIKIVCGAWKKVNPEIKDDLRKAIAVGGAGIRMVEEPFIYLDKNYVRMLGGIRSAVSRAAAYPERTVVVQLRGDFALIAEEAIEAVEAGADILMVDTGRIEDLKKVIMTGINAGWRERVRIAFAGGVTKQELGSLIELGTDIVDIGRAIIDAPLLDYRLDVVYDNI